jgi:hypothetical protein
MDKFITDLRSINANTNQCSNVLYVDMDEKIADLFLSKNTHNRNVNKQRSSINIDRLKNIFLRGEWDPDASEIVFGSNDVLLDGQHRLLAYKKAGCPKNIKFKVAFGVNPSAQKCIDTPMVRLLSENLKLHNVFPNHHNRMARIFKALYAVDENGKMTSKPRDPTPDWVENAFKNDYSFIETEFKWFDGVKQKGGGVHDNAVDRSDVMAAICYFYKNNADKPGYKERIMDFYNQARQDSTTGNFELPTSDKRGILYQFVVDYRKGFKKYAKSQTRHMIEFDYVIELLSAYCEGRPVCKWDTFRKRWEKARGLA